MGLARSKIHLVAAAKRRKGGLGKPLETAHVVGETFALRYSWDHVVLPSLLEAIAGAEGRAMPIAFCPRFQQREQAAAVNWLARFLTNGEQVTQGMPSLAS